MRLHAHGHPDRIGADHSATDDDDIGRLHARHPTEQYSGAACFALETMGAGLHRHAPRHLTHRRQQRQRLTRAGDRFVCYRYDTCFHEPPCLFRIRREMEVREEDLALAQHVALLRLRFLDLDDEFSAGKHLVRIVDDAGPGRAVIVVACPYAQTGACLDDDVVAVM